MIKLGVLFNPCDSVYKEVTMSHWNIAAAQYGGQHHSVDDHIAHHLHFIAEAAHHLINRPGRDGITASARRRSTTAIA